MAKFYGVVGFAETEETSADVWDEQFTERPYYGDLLQNSSRFQATEHLNDDLTVSNKISIVADPFANQNFHLMRYVEFMGVKWKITNVDVQYPRIVLTIGGVYNA